MEEFRESSREVSPPAEETAVQPRPKKSGILKWIGIGCLGLIVLIVLIVMLALRLTGGIVDVAEAQLKALKAGDFEKAYSYTSKDFQKSTSIQQFKEFVDSHSSLKEYKSVTFTSREINNNLGTLKGSLTSESGATTPIEYKLVKEGGEWKILSINLEATGPSEKTETRAVQGAEVVDVTLGTRFNDKTNEVSNPSDSFKPNDATIYCSVFIKNAKKGMEVSALLDFENGRGTVGPVKTKIKNSGDIVSAFTFSKPASGWPKGNYEIKISLNKTEVKGASFTVK